MRKKVVGVDGIQASINLNDQFSYILNHIVNSVNLAISSVYDMQDCMSADIDTNSIAGARDEINQATAAIIAMNDALNQQAGADIAAPNVSAAQRDVTVPVRWETDSLDVFVNSGVERFQQEVQSANSMLEQLYSTQEAIASQAVNTDLFPPDSFQDLNRLTSRIDAMRSRIQQVENNPLNLGTDTASAELEQLRAQLSLMLQEQNDLNQAMQNMDVSAANEAYLRLSQTVSGTERYIRDNVDEQGRFNQEIQKGVQQSNQLANMIKKAAAAYISVQGVGKVLDISDNLIQTTARLNIMNDGLQRTEELVNMTYAAAQDARGSFASMADVVARFGNNAGNAFESSAEIIAFANLIQKQMTIAGASTQEAANATLQLSQGLAAGALRGEELNSILEQAPTIARTIESAMGWDAGSIKSYAEQGLVTAEVVKNAMLGSADEINAKFYNMDMTWGQTWQSMQNTALISFRPVLQKVNDLANSETFQRFANGAGEALAVVAGIMLNIFELASNTYGFVADNWSMLSPIIYGIAAALAVYYGAQLAANTIDAISQGIHIAMAAAQMLHAAATGGLTAATAAEIAAQNGLNAAMYACPIVWIIVLIIALIALFYAAVAVVNHFAGTSISATGLIAGYFAVCAAHLINGFIRIQNVVASFLNFFRNAFDDPIAAVKVLFYDLCLTVIGYILNMATAIESVINKIPGIEVDITSGLDNFYSEIEAAQQQVKDESGWVEYVEKWDYIDYTDAWDAGYSFGEGIDESIANFSLSDLFGGTDDIPQPEDYLPQEYLYDDKLDDMSGDLGAIRDSLEISAEELKYLRDAAEQESINRFTTAEIKIDMSGMQNNINSDDDIDGFITKLTDSVNEAVDSTLEGVHE